MNSVRAGQLHQRACDIGDALEGVELLEYACERKIPEACLALEGVSRLGPTVFSVRNHPLLAALPIVDTSQLEALDIQENLLITNLDALDGFDPTTGYIEISGMEGLTDISGLGALEVVTWGIHLLWLPKLESLHGLENLREVVGTDPEGQAVGMTLHSLVLWPSDSDRIGSFPEPLAALHLGHWPRPAPSERLASGPGPFAKSDQNLPARALDSLLNLDALDPSLDGSLVEVTDALRIGNCPSLPSCAGHQLESNATIGFLSMDGVLECLCDGAKCAR